MSEMLMIPMALTRRDAGSKYHVLSGMGIDISEVDSASIL